MNEKIEIYKEGNNVIAHDCRNGLKISVENVVNFEAAVVEALRNMTYVWLSKEE